MSHPSRALTALAACALALPLLATATPALAAPPDPGPPRSTADFCAPVPATYDPFVDDEPNTFTREIECVAYAAIAQGNPRGIGADRYGPGFEVARDQMASFIARMIDAANNLDTGEAVRPLPGYDGTNAFSDVASGNPHLQAINRLQAVGITVGAPAGKEPGQYGPELLVTRAQMATFVNRAIAWMAGEDPAQAGNGTGLTTVLDYFTDDESTAPHEPNINGLASEGINVGDGQDTVRPFAPIKRDQMAAFIARTLAYLEEAGDIGPVVENAATEDPGGGPQPPPAGEDIAVTPDGELAARVAVPNPDTVTNDDQTYTVSGLVTGQEYRVTLVVEANVTRNGAGEEVFAEDGTTGLAATGSPTADITTIDGQPAQNNSGDGTARTATGPSNGGTAVFTADADGEATVVVDGDQAPESVLPVAYRNGGPSNTDADGGQSPRLELDDDGTAAEAYDVGAVIDFEDTTVATATVRPELQSTGIVRTSTDEGPTPTPADDRQLTEVRFTFDEPVTGKTPTADRFHLVGFDSSTRYDGTDAVVQSDGRSVLVTFGAPATASDPEGQSVGSAELRDISLATVDFDAVRDVSQAENPLGDDTIGASRTEATGAAGKTDAPDLDSVGGVVSPAGQDRTTVVFTFDEPAFTVGTTGFHLVTPNSQDVVCTAVDGAAGGQPGADEDATATVRVTCPETAFGGDFTAADIARGYVDAGTVSDTEQNDLAPGTEGASNPLQATQAPDADTTSPNLVSAAFQASDGTKDVVVYTFDESVLVLDDTDADGTLGSDTDTDGAGGAGDFRVYPITGGPGTSATSVVRSTTNPDQVEATFADGATADAVGVNVEEGAVVGATGVERRNQEDEVGVENLRQQTFTAGRTDGPDLVGVALGSDGTATYAFDEDVLTDLSGTPTHVDETRLFLVLADGTRLRCTASRVEAAGRTDADTVTCTAYAVQITGGGTATAEQVRNAVLGTVDDQAVRDTASEPNLNPEGGELTTGGTGTPAS